MECNKGPKKLWDRYIAKYGDFRNHIDAIRADYQCYLNFRIPFSCPSVDQCSKQKVQTKIAKATLETSFFKYNNRLPPKYCKYQQQHDNLSDTGIRTALITDNNDHIDIAQIKAIMRAEDFPDNLFSTTSERRPVLLKRQIGENYANCISASSSTQDARRSKTDLRSRTALLKHDVHEVLVSTVQHDNKTAAQPPSNKHISSDISEYSLSKSRKSIVELLPSTAIRPSQYRELFKKLNRNDEHHRISPNETHFSLTKNVMTSKINNTQLNDKIQSFLTFFRSLDQEPDMNLNENIIQALFSVDNHLSSSIYVPTNVQRLSVVPQTILHLPKTNNDDDYQIESQYKRKKHIVKDKVFDTASASPKLHYSTKRLKRSTKLESLKTVAYGNEFSFQDTELNAKLSTAYSVKAFKDYLIQRSARLPKVSLFL